LVLLEQDKRSGKRSCYAKEQNELAGCHLWTCFTLILALTWSSNYVQVKQSRRVAWMFVCRIKIRCNGQGRNERRQRGRDSPGSESLWGRQITGEGAEKFQQCRNYFLQQHICFQKILGSNMGAPNLLLAPDAI